MTENTHALVERTERGLVVLKEFASWDEALAAFEKAGPGHAVRASADPNLIRPLPYVKLDRTEREWLLDIGRRAGGLEAAKDEMVAELISDPRFSHLESVEIFDYCWAAAKFCFPREYAESWK